MHVLGAESGSRPEERRKGLGILFQRGGFRKQLYTIEGELKSCYLAFVLLSKLIDHE